MTDPVGNQRSAADELLQIMRRAWLAPRGDLLGRIKRQVDLAWLDPVRQQRRPERLRLLDEVRTGAGRIGVVGRENDRLAPCAEELVALVALQLRQNQLPLLH